MKINDSWKCYLLTITSILTSLSASAAETISSNDPLLGSGLYLGSGLQYNLGDVDYTSNTTFSAGIENTATQTADISANGFSGIALLGYGFPLCNQFYMGMEMQGAIMAGQRGSTSTSAFFSDGTEVIALNAKVKISNNYGVFLRPGYYPNQNMLLFLRGGYINGRFETDTGAGELGGSSDVSQNKRANGYLLGLGTEMRITKEWGARIEYDYSRYETINVNNAITFPTPSSGGLVTITANTTGQFSPQISVVSLMLTYTFENNRCHFSSERT